MEQFLNSRLQLYTNLIGKYDMIDKEFYTTCNSMPKLSTISLHFSNSTNIEYSSFNTFLDKELLTCQRVNLFKLYRQKAKSCSTRKFSVTLRSTFLYVYLDFFIHTHFFSKNSFLSKNQNCFIFAFYQKLCNSFFTLSFRLNLNSFFNEKNNLYLIFLHFDNNVFLSQLKYYFISAF